MHKKSLLGAAVCTLALLGMTTAPASAAGQVERGPDHANSICSFSGQNDTPTDPVEGGRVQSFGQIIAFGNRNNIPDLSTAALKAAGEFPGNLCNGHKFPYPEAFAEEPAP
jgi:poly(3-hydroxybutyrate) depolymerase